jgi:PAS domain S-box-containing protein
MPQPSKKENQPDQTAFSDPHDILMNAPIGVYTSTPEGRYMSANPALAEMYGYDSPEELIESVTDIAEQLYVDAADREEVSRLLEVEGRVYNYECRLRRKDGSIIWTSRNVREVRDSSGKNIHYQGFVTDITRSKQTRQELDETRWELSTILDSVPVMIWRKDQDSKYIHANKMFCDIVGRELEDIKGKSDYDVHPKEIATKYVSDDNLVLSSGRPVRNISERHKKSTGQTGWSLTEKLPCYDKDGNIAGTIGFALDITEIKRADDALRGSEELFRTLIETMAEGIVLKDASDRYVHWNQTASELFGIGIDEVKGQTTDSFKRQIIREDGSAFHKDDLPSLHTLRTGEPCRDVIMGIRRSPQDTSWVKANTRPYNKAGDGKPGGVIISFADITKGKQSEERIRHLNAVLKSLVMVNKVIFNARKVNQLLEDICHALTATRGYHNAWIILLDEDRRITHSAQAGVGETFQGLLSRFQQGKISSCVCKALESSLIQIVQDPYTECVDCPLAGHYSGRAGLSVGLEVEGKVIGLLAVSVPKELARDHEEHELFMNLAQTIAQGVRRIRLEEIRRDQERRLHHYRQIISRINDPMSLVDKDYRYIVVNDAYLRIFNRPRHEIEGHTVERLLGRDVFFGKVKPHLDEALSGREVVYEDSFPGPDGTPRYRIMSYYPYHDGEGEVRGVVSRALDTTERRQAEDFIRESEERFHKMLGVVPDMISIHSPEMDILYSNWQGFGAVPETMRKINTKCYNTYRGRTDVCPDCRAISVLDTKKPMREETRLPDGTWLDLRVIPLLDKDNNVEMFMEWVRDITERKQAEEALRESEETLRATLHSIGDAVISTDMDGLVVGMNPVAESLTGWNDEDATGQPLETVFRIINEQTRQPVESPVINVLRSGKIVGLANHTLLIARDGREIPIADSGAPVRNEAGDITGVVLVFRDQTQERAAREALEANYALLQIAGETARFGGWSVDLENNVCTWSDAVADIHEVPRGFAPKVEDGINFYAPEWQDKITQVFSACAENGIPYDEEMKIITRKGKRVWVRTNCKAVRNEEGKIIKVQGSFQDITERKLAAEEKEKLQAQLNQAQKMESIGMLAGGVAHDFNNLLHAMGGNLDLLNRKISDDHPGKKRIHSIQKSVDRASQLVRKLLLFSRKADIQTQVLDLNQEIHDAVKLLERSIPKMINIELILDENAWPINADPIQVEQVLLNLGTNAADAMPDGGRLIIETSNAVLEQDFIRTHTGAKPGKYVLMTVSDTGTGMDRETLQHVFDPFFTTKELGKGTGLGLSSVFGIVKAHGGYIICYSEPGQGTTFKIYWPAAEQGEIEPSEIQTEQAVSQDGTETILLVDDDEQIRELTSEVLEDSGYQVISASSGEQALEIFRKKAKDIDLVLMDLNMPGMGGSQCTREMITFDPSVRVLVASGYAANGHGKAALEFGAKDFISKPFQAHKLLAKIRQVLDDQEEQL